MVTLLLLCIHTLILLMHSYITASFDGCWSTQSRDIDTFVREAKQDQSWSRQACTATSCAIWSYMAEGRPLAQALAEESWGFGRHRGVHESQGQDTSGPPRWETMTPKGLLGAASHHHTWPEAPMSTFHWG